MGANGKDDVHEVYQLPPDLRLSGEERLSYTPRSGSTWIRTIIKRICKEGASPFESEFRRYKFYHPDGMMQETEFEQRQNALRSVASGILHLGYPINRFEWRSFGDDVTSSKERAKEIHAGATPTWEECVRYMAFYLRVFALKHPRGLPMPPPSGIVTTGGNTDDWYSEAVQVPASCAWCGKEAGLDVCVCKDCAAEAGIHGDYTAIGDVDANLAYIYATCILDERRKENESKK